MPRYFIVPLVLVFALFISMPICWIFRFPHWEDVPFVIGWMGMMSILILAAIEIYKSEKESNK